MSAITKQIAAVEFHVNARQANAALESMRQSAEDAREEMAKLQEQSDKGVKTVMVGGKDMDITKRIRDLNATAKAFEQAAQSQIKGVKAWDELWQHAKMGNIEQLTGQQIKAGVNGAKRQYDRLILGDEEDRRKAAAIRDIIDQADIVLAKLKGDTDKVIQTLSDGGHVADEVLQREKKNLEDMMSLTEKFSPEWQDYNRQLQAITKGIEEQAAQEKRLRGELVDANDARREAAKLDKDVAQAAKEQHAAQQQVIDDAQKQMQQYQEQRRQHQEEAQKITDEIAKQDRQIASQSQLVESIKRENHERTKKSNVMVQEADQADKTAAKAKRAADSSAKVVERFSDKLQKAKDDVAKLQEQLDKSSDNDKQAVVIKLTKALDKQSKAEEDLKQKEKDAADAQEMYNRATADAIAKHEALDKAKAEGNKKLQEESQKLSQLQGTREANVASLNQEKEAIKQKNEAVDAQAKIINDAQQTQAKSRQLSIESIEKSIALLKQENRIIGDETNPQWVENEKTIGRLNRRLSEMKQHAAELRGEAMSVSQAMDMSNADSGSIEQMEKAVSVLQQAQRATTDNVDASRYANAIDNLTQKLREAKGEAVSLEEAMEMADINSKQPYSIEEMQKGLKALQEQQNTAIDPSKYTEAIDTLTQKIREAKGEAVSLEDALNFGKQGLDGSFKGTNEQLRQAKQVLESTLATTAKGSDRYKEIREALAGIAIEEKRVGEVSGEVQKILDAPKGRSFNELKVAVEQGRKELNSMTRTTKEGQKAYDELAEKVKAADLELKNLGNDSKGTQSSFEKAVSRLKTYVTLYMGTDVALQKMSGAADDMLELSDKMGEVRKTTGFSADEVGRLSDNLAKLDTRTPIQNLMDLSAVAGQLGLNTEEDVRGFTEAANKMLVALPEMGEDGATEMMKIAIATKEVDKIRKQMANGTVEGSSATAVAMEKIASTIDRLRATTAAAAPPVADFVKRVGAVGAQSGITVDQVAALGATVDSVGMGTEMAATAISRMIPAIKNNAFDIAHAIGVTPETIRNMYEGGHAMDVILMILKHIKEENLNPDGIEKLLGSGGMAEIMKELNQHGARAGIVFAGLSQNVDELERNLQTAHSAYEEGTAIMDEYNKMNDTTAGKLERLKNQIQEVFVNNSNQQFFGYLIDVLRAVVNWLTGSNGVSAGLRAIILLVALMKANVASFVIGGLLAAWRGLKNIAIMLNVVKGTLTKMQMANIITAIAGAVVYLVYEISQLKSATELANEALGKANEQVGRAIDRFEGYWHQVTEADTALHKATVTHNRLSAEVDKLRNSTDKSSNATALLSKKEKELHDSENAVSKATGNHRIAISNINAIYGKYLGFILTERNYSLLAASAHDQVTAAIKREMLMKEKQAAISNIDSQYSSQLAEDYGKLSDKMSKAGLSRSQVAESRAWLQNWLHSNIQRDKKTGRTVVSRAAYNYLRSLGLDVRNASANEMAALAMNAHLWNRYRLSSWDRGSITGVAFDPRHKQSQKGWVTALTGLSTNVRAGFASTYVNREQERGAVEDVFNADIDYASGQENNAFAKSLNGLMESARRDRNTIYNSKNKKEVSEAYEDLANSLNGLDRYMSRLNPRRDAKVIANLKGFANSLRKDKRFDATRLQKAQENLTKSQTLADMATGGGTTNYTPTTPKIDPGPTQPNPWGDHPDAATTNWSKMNGKDLVARRKQMNEFVLALQGDTDVESVLSEDPALMAAMKKGKVKKDADSVIAWYDQQRLAIQDVLHSRALTNTGNWKDPKVAHQRAKSISAMVKNDMSYYMDELDAYYTEQKSQIEDAQNSGLITEEEGWRRLLENDRIWRQRRAELQQLYAGKTKEVTQQEADNIYSIIADRTGDTADFIKVNIGKTNDLIHQAGLKNVSVERRILGDLDKGTEQDFLKMRTAVKKQLDAIEEIVSKERPFDGIVKNLRQNVEKMGIIYTDLDKQKEKLILSGKGNGSDEMKALNEEYAKERPNRLTFLLKESENAYQKTGDTLLSDMRANSFSSWADAITQSDDADKLKEALVAQLHTVYDSVQDAIKKEASEVKKQVDIAWNDTNVPLIGGKSMKNLYEAAANALGVEQQSVSRANSLIGAGAASERVADKLAIRQLQIQFNMQEHYYALVRKIGQQRVDDLKRQEEQYRKQGDYAKAEEAALDAKHAKMSLNLTLSEEETDLAKQRAEINARVEESQNRLYTSLKEWGTLLSSSMQSLFEASNTGAADYYNNLAKMRLTGEGSAGGTYVIIDKAGTKDAKAHYENLDGEDALKRQLEIEQQNAVADAWKKVMDDINKKISDQITDWMNAALQTQSIDANTAALEANTAALYATRPKNEGTAAPTAGKWEMGKDENSNTLYPLQPTEEAESGDLSKWPRARRKRAGLSADGKYDAPVWQLSPLQQEDAEQHSAWAGLSEYGEQGTSMLPNITDDQIANVGEQSQLLAQAQIDADDRMTQAKIDNQNKVNSMVLSGNSKQLKNTKSMFAAMVSSCNLYGAAYQAMSNDNLETAQKFQMITLQGVGSMAMAGLEVLKSQMIADAASNSPGVLGKLWSQLGYWAAPVYAVFTGLLGGLMGLATSKIGKSKAQIAQVTGASVSAGRLSTGMLTYATGNVNEFTDPSTLTPGQQYNVDAADGHTYRARYMGANPKTHLTNGPEFHLVGERGREAIIDANTTRQLQMDDTGIWKSIQTLYNGGSIRSVRRGGMKAFATGNIDELGEGATAAEVSSDGTAPATSNTDLLAALQASLDRNTEVMQKAVEHGIKGVFNVYGKDGLIDSYDRGKKNANRYGERY